MADFTNIKVGDKVITHFSTRGTPFFETAKVVKVLKKYFVAEIDRSDTANRVGTCIEYRFDGGRRGEANMWGQRSAPARHFDERYVRKYEAAKNRHDMIRSIEKQTGSCFLVEMTDEELLELLDCLCKLSGKREARKLAEIQNNEREALIETAKLAGQYQESENNETDDGN